ncbi:ribokinase [Phocaeicola barnesiae]|jgi:sugar/nucleoside kinase (ribokinase family)|uniref:PfkB family carbohydrate kinase n=2 Tax=Phocaeicola barnesiae TaxID=376804 RepID=A0AAW5N9E3_9BACT|nr:PfkB family carbohydrate kinase [Phocaeicola barnesiae]MCF2576065.1 ribokinase [Phocaeicola barnesiae]MCF2598899.1 ribokinase [Phocaeicola barnesiae]MCR8874489.1 PfkB family carbohydrate kinase [Phocaeicola barnesiae]MDM8232951.1 PfkB family carbohydrate kinase [Phocaeicola barnesiae]MDM8242268.1 PfkB family carbohydrate kinase [Phocaeicola barnesiae]
MNDICCIGHITLDKIVTPKQTTYMPGGTSYYFSHGIKHLKDKDNYKLVTALAPSEYKAVEEMRSAGIQVEVLPSKKTVYFENVYGENQDNRTQRVLAKADPFTVEELKNEEARIFHLGSLLSDDFSLDVVKLLSGKGILAVDAQGYLREVRGQKVFPVDWKDKREALKYIDILKVNEHEAEVLTGYKDAKQAALQLAEWGVKEVLLTLGSLGSLIYAEGVFHQIPAYPPKEVVDATGCGDTYAMGYLYMRNKGASYEEAGCFAAAMSTIKLEKSGPFSGTEEQVWNIIRNSNLHPQVI